MGHRARQGGWELGPRQQGKRLKTAVTGTCWLQAAHFVLTCNKSPRAATMQRGTGEKLRQKDNSPEPTQPFRTTEPHQGKGCRVQLSPAGLWAELSLPGSGALFTKCPCRSCRAGISTEALPPAVSGPCWRRNQRRLSPSLPAAPALLAEPHHQQMPSPSPSHPAGHSPA